MHNFAAERRADGRHPLRLVRRQVLEAQDAALGPDALYDRLGDRAFVKALGTF